MNDELIEALEFFEEHDRLEDVAPHFRLELDGWKQYHISNFIEEITEIATKQGFTQQLINKLQEND